MSLLPLLLVLAALLSPRPAGAATFLVDVPHGCLRQDPSPAGELRLSTASFSCGAASTRFPAELPEGTLSVELYLDGKHLGRRELAPASLSEVVSGALGRAATLPPPILPAAEPDAVRAAQRLFAATRTPEFEGRVADAVRGLDPALAAKLGEERVYRDLPELSGNGRRLPPDERLYVFISSSIPLSAARNYAADLERLSDPSAALYLRGVVGGDLSRFRPTLDYVMSVLTREGGCDFKSEPCPLRKNVGLAVDAALFRRFAVERVPAFVYAWGVSALDPEWSEGEADNARVGGWQVVYGDATLERALEELQERTERPGVGGLLEHLREGR